MTDPILNLWAQDASDARGFTPAQMHARAQRLRRRLIVRDSIEYAAGALVVAVFAWVIWVAPVWSVRVACAAIIVGTLVVMRNLWRRRMPAPPEALGTESLAFYRRELVRQRDSLRNVWRWYLAPFVPGTLLFLAAVWWETARHLPAAAAALPVLAILAGDAALFWFIHWLNRRAADRLDAEITALDDAV